MLAHMSQSEEPTASPLGLYPQRVTAELVSACFVQIVGVGAVDLSQAMFILNPGTVVPVTVDLFRPEKAGMAKFVGGGVAGAAALGKGVGKAGLSGLFPLKAYVMAA